MMRKIVAIGGGENGRTKSDGTVLPYETDLIDQEIIKLTEKRNPHFLFLAHAAYKEGVEESYFKVMKKIYGDMYNCECRNLTKADVKEDFEKAKDYVEWADIIYEGGGDTKSMMELWINTGFDKVLRNAWENGKVMCGISAGGNCWFDSCSSDSLQIQLKDETAPLITVECLGFIEAFFTPHSYVATKYTNRLEHQKESLREKDLVGLAISNCAAIEIVDDEYRLITSDALSYGIEAYGLKTYWKDDKYIEEYIDKSDEFKKVKDLLELK